MGDRGSGGGWGAGGGSSSQPGFTAALQDAGTGYGPGASRTARSPLCLLVFFPGPGLGRGGVRAWEGAATGVRGGQGTAWGTQGTVLGCKPRRTFAVSLLLLKEGHSETGQRSGSRKAGGLLQRSGCSREVLPTCSLSTGLPPSHFHVGLFSPEHVLLTELSPAKQGCLAGSEHRAGASPHPPTWRPGSRLLLPASLPVRGPCGHGHPAGDGQGGAFVREAVTAPHASGA